MPPAGSPTKLLRCPSCRAVLNVPARRLGKPIRCGGCGEVVRLGPAKARPERSVGFSCRVCQTRMSMPAKYAGKRVECPDCGTKNTIPEPPPEREPVVPEAMHGQQYGVWSVDGPLPSEIRDRHPRYIAVHCRLCQTLMHARPEQVGQMLDCPDCGAKTVVTAPVEEAASQRVLVPDGDEYQLDESSAPTDRPMPAAARRIEEESRAAGSETAPRLERSQKPPRLPLVSGVARMLIRSPVSVWWFGLSVWLAVLIALLIVPVQMGALGGGGQAGVAGALMTVAAYACVCILGPIWLAAMASLCGAVLEESSDGVDVLASPPGRDFTDWFGWLWLIVVSAGASTLPGWAAGALGDWGAAEAGVSLVLEVRVVAPLLGVLLCFPVMLLSALENGSSMDVFSKSVWGSVLRRPLHWLLFYVEAAVLAAGCAAAILWMGDSAWAAAPMLVAAGLVYFRLLGRLGWWLSESLRVASTAD
ncbi:MAG: hypothetical protein AAGA92_04910 [Planctomycetota bacterium]